MSNRVPFPASCAVRTVEPGRRPILYKLKLIHKAKGSHGEAKACFEEARSIAEAVEMTTQVGQNDAAFADL